MYSIHHKKLISKLDISHLKIIYISKGNGRIRLNNKKIIVKKGTYLRVNKGVNLVIDDTLEYYIVYIFPEYIYNYLNFLENTKEDTLNSLKNELFFLDYSLFYLQGDETTYIDLIFETINNWNQKSPIPIMFLFNLSFQLTVGKRNLGSKSKKDNILNSLEDKNINFKKYSRDKKVRRGIRLLEQTNYKIEEVSNLCGINNASYFIKLVKDRLGVTPKVYREKIKTIKY